MECKSYQITESYERGGLNPSGIYQRGEVRTTRRRVPCTNAGWKSAHYSPHHHAPVPYGYGHPYPQHYPTHQAPAAAQAVQVNSAPAVAGQCDQLTRMGLGALGGGIAGRYLVGGRKSSKTVLGTTVGAVSGLLVGRVLPC